MNWPLLVLGIIWALVLIGGLTYQVLPELKRTRFSLRTLLIATTLIAVALGLAVFASSYTAGYRDG